MFLAFSCKTNCLCPSCAQRRALDFGDWVVNEVIQGVPIVSCTFTIPKMLRIYFKFDHSLFPELSKCAYETMKECFQAALDNDALVPGMITGVHSAGKVLNFHPHIHGVVSAGCFDKEGTFYHIPFMPDREKLVKVFMHKVLRMMMEKDKIHEDIVEKLTSWTNSGFNVHTGDEMGPGERKARERAARYLVRASVSLEKMTYVPQQGKVVYGNSGNSVDTKTYDALDFLALLSCHITDRWERRVIPYGFWSNKSRGIRKKQEQETSEEVQIREPVLSSKAYRRKWAARVKKIWNTDPLVCPSCGEKMSIIAFIDEYAVVRKILVSMDLWEIPPRAPPKPLPQDVHEWYEYECAS
jgi:hypothetical protein